MAWQKHKPKPNSEPLWFAADTEAQTVWNDEHEVELTKQARIRAIYEDTPEARRAVGEARAKQCDRMTTYLLGYTPVYKYVNLGDKVTKYSNKYTHKAWLGEVKHWYTNRDEDLWHYMLDDIIDNYGELIRQKSKYKAVIFFHNLSYDVQNFLSHIVEGKINVGEVKPIWNVTYYSVSFTYKGHCFELRDSMKLYAQSLASLAKLVGWEKQTNLATYEWFDLQQDVDKLLNEIEYFRYDIAILGAVIRMYRKEFPYPKTGKLTIAGHAEYELQKLIKKEDKILHEDREAMLFNPSFTDAQDNYIRSAYFGGFVYAEQKLLNTELSNGLVFDVNSLYPSVMKYRNYPDYRTLRPMTRHEFTNLDLSDLNTFGIVTIHITALNLKPNGVPCIPKKAGFGMPHEITSLRDVDDDGDGSAFVLTISTIDLYHIVLNYNIKYIFLEGIIAETYYKTPLKSYVEKFEKMKEDATKSGDKVRRQTAKLLLNSVYGKFAQNLIVDEAQLDEFNGVATMQKVPRPASEIEKAPRHNILIAVFITAFARDTLLKCIENINSSPLAEFWYCDTDSVHFGYTGSYDRLSEPDKIAAQLNIPYDEAIFGSWKNEQQIARGKYLGSKRYWEQDDALGYDVLKVAGVQKLGKEFLIKQGMSNFQYDKNDHLIVPFLQKSIVKGGVKLYDSIKLIEPNTYQVRALERYNLI